VRLFRPELEPSSIKCKKPYKRMKLFGCGQAKSDDPRGHARSRQADDDGGSSGCGCVDLDFSQDAAKGTKNRVRANLLYLAMFRGEIVKEGEREATRWALNETGPRHLSR
jgi:hypothetical protein